MESPAEIRRILVSLTHRVGEGADATQIADVIVSTWQAVDEALTPVIGQHGVVSLYKRSLFLASPTYPWLAGTHEEVQMTMDLATLKSALVQQGSAIAAIAGAAVLQTFYEVLANLVGPSLTERLLRSVWENSHDAPTQRITS